MATADLRDTQFRDRWKSGKLSRNIWALAHPSCHLEVMEKTSRLSRLRRAASPPASNNYYHRMFLASRVSRSRQAAARWWVSTLLATHVVSMEQARLGFAVDRGRSEMNNVSDIVLAPSQVPVLAPLHQGRTWSLWFRRIMFHPCHAMYQAA